MSPTSSLLSILLLSILAIIALSSAQATNQCTGKVNNKPFLSKDPVFVKSVPNGKRYLAGDADHPLHIVHVYGSPYEMGKAYGQLMRDEIGPTFREYRDYLMTFIEKFIPKIPKKLADIILHFGLNAALDLEWEMTRLYTPQRYIDELNGMAEGSGVDVVELRRFNLLPELIKADCTVLGAWGDATKNTSLAGNVFQVRALDWDAHATIKKTPVAIVYHPSESGSNTFVNVAWPGFIGSLTGVSDAMVGISEKVWLTESDIDTRFGIPWTYALRDVLQYSTDLDSALNMLINTNRTCSIHVGIGSSQSNSFRGVEYSYKILNIYDWSTQPEYDAHPRLKDVVYWDKHKQPTHDTCLGDLLKKYHGSMDAETTIRHITSIHETGDMQLAVYDFTAKKLYVSNAGPDSDPDMEAYKRSFVVLDLDKLFSEKM